MENKLPWKIGEDEAKLPYDDGYIKYYSWINIFDSNGNQVTSFNKRDKELAQFTVKACNNYEAMKEMLSKFYETLTGCMIAGAMQMDLSEEAKYSNYAILDRAKQLLSTLDEVSI